MKPTAWLTLALYCALIGALATPLYEPLYTGVDHSGFIYLLFVGAGLGLGAGVGRPWAALLPIPAAATLLFESVQPRTLDDHLSILAVTVVAVALAGIGSFAPLGSGWRLALAAVAAALCLPAVILGSLETIDRAGGRELTGAEVAALPVDLNVLCKHRETRGRIQRTTLRLARFLELVEREPHARFQHTYTFSDYSDRTRTITVRELAREWLEAFESRRRCRYPIAERLREALR